MAVRVIEGVGASPGIGIGRAFLYRGTEAANLPPGGGGLPALTAEGDRPAELERVRQAFLSAGAELERVMAETRTRLGEAEAAVFEAQRFFLVDPALVEPLEAAIRDQGLPVAQAVEKTLEAGASELEALDDPYLRARATDLRDVKRRLLRLLGLSSPESLRMLGAGTILIAADLIPSETIELQPENVLGLVLAEGAPTAHAAILARSLGLPLVVGTGPLVWEVQPGQPVLVDGDAGTVLVEPNEQELADVRRLFIARQHVPDTGNRDAELPVQTRDGRRIDLLANASSPSEARRAVGNGANGIGLLRTEFMLASLMRGTHAAPNEDQVAEAYGAILQVLGERPVVVRAMDAGGDKPLPFLDFGGEANPALGWRGIRILLEQPELLAGQTRALLRAAAQYQADVRLMFPMVSSLDEFIKARNLVETVCRDELQALAHPLQFGVMIEVPAAALIADALAQEADFFSLGTNDLVQYTLACDRANARVGHLATILHPAVLRLIDMVVRAAHQAGRTVGVCGEAAADVLVIPVLIGLGVDELSVVANRLPEVRQCIRQLEYSKLGQLVATALTQSTVEQVVMLLNR